jgi:hypothetical protein
MYVGIVPDAQRTLGGRLSGRIHQTARVHEGSTLLATLENRMTRITTPIAILTITLAVVVTSAGPEDDSGAALSAENSVYLAVFRTAIDQRRTYDRREGDVFLLSLNAWGSEAPQRRLAAIKDPPPEILSELSQAGLPVRPGSQPVQPHPERLPLDSETLPPEIRIIVNRVSWVSEVEALVYYEVYRLGTLPAAKIFRLRHQGREWSVVAVESEWNPHEHGG